MIMNYKECVARYGSLWRMKQAIAAGKLFKIELGIYAETDHVPEELLYLGVMEWNKDGNRIPVYDKERMLIELLRYKHRMPADLYKEALHNYRARIYEIDLLRVWKYAEQFPKEKVILRRLEEEVL